MYTTTKAFFTIRRLELVDKKEFVVTTLNSNDEIFIIYIISLASFNLNIHLSYKTYIALLNANKMPTTILLKYTKFVDIFSSDLVTKFLRYTKINNHIINLIDDK